MQRCRYYANISMDIYAMMNALTMQHYECYASIPMNEIRNINALMVQRRRHYVNLLMNVFVIMNISNPQHRMYYDDYSMNVFNIVNVLMVQLGTSCVFDSPGLARNEPTPGKRSQGDSTPSVLSFFCEGTLTMKPFMAD